jgi:hypothetical protein
VDLRGNTGKSAKVDKTQGQDLQEKKVKRGQVKAKESKTRIPDAAGK